jgi:hypothetical protein
MHHTLIIRIISQVMFVRRRAWVKKTNRWGPRQVQVLDGLQKGIEEMTNLKEHINLHFKVGY